MRYLKIIFLLVLLCIFSCDKDTTPTLVIPLCSYEYQAFDSTGTSIVAGRIKFDIIENLSPEDFANNIKIFGDWHFNKIGDPRNIGNQIGSGKLNGLIDDDTIWINLNPNISDDNVTLVGKMDGNRIEGVWGYSTFAGLINSGLFRAEKR